MVTEVHNPSPPAPLPERGEGSKRCFLSGPKPGGAKAEAGCRGSQPLTPSPSPRTGRGEQEMFPIRSQARRAETTLIPTPTQRRKVGMPDQPISSSAAGIGITRPF
jgi:hypothetical protein